MKTLVIISHPDLDESSSQQFLLAAIPKNENITVHHLEINYPDGNIDVFREQELLLAHDRIIFQFPFYWYSSPALLKHWQDVVLTEGFAYGQQGSMLAGKEFCLVLAIGVKESEYQAGGRELYSISELTKPYQALAFKTEMIYLKPLLIFQFAYLTHEQKIQLYMDYQQALTREKDDSLQAREKWLLSQLENMDKQNLADAEHATLSNAIAQIKSNRSTIEELRLILEQMR
ncbi:NAD(P)H-dependent oxidoreductase [Virgibacillus halophilus]|uniref:NAD(P)H-dependent oxidoreductase n=1 Tax=Tigheibacillus halophilus TaxID=361280 RepID=A0ABU5C8G1_9BACI|nr:NAD(P)H-dependent oxidoreductase [Virgibacillus halophilus]